MKDLKQIVKMEIKDILEGCKNNCDKSISELYSVVTPTLYRVCNGFSNSRYGTDDLVHETFLRGLENIEKVNTNINSLGEINSWFRRLGYNYCVDKFRKRKEFTIVEEIDLSLFMNGYEEEYHESPYSVSDINSVLHKISPRFKQTFILYFYEGMSHEQVAEIMEISVGSSKSNLHKAKQKIKKLVLSN